MLPGAPFVVLLQIFPPRQPGLGEQADDVADDAEEDGELESHDKKGNQGDHGFAADDEAPFGGGVDGQEKPGEKPDDAARQGEIAHLALGAIPVQDVHDLVAGDGAVDLVELERRPLKRFDGAHGPVLVPEQPHHIAFNFHGPILSPGFPSSRSWRRRAGA